MIYRAQGEDRLWDTWLLEDGGNVHLFYLIYQKDLSCVSIGHATSDDLIHWDELPPIDLLDAGGNIGTGCALIRNHTMYLFYTVGMPDGQQIFLSTSSDGNIFTPYNDNPVMRIESPYSGNDFRDPAIYLNAESQQYEAYLCSYLSGRDIGACIARYLSKDLIHWNAAPPLAVVDERFTLAETPSYFRIADRHYISFYSSDRYTPNIITPHRIRPCGTFYMIADTQNGEYRFTENPLLLGSGNGRMEAIVGRVTDFRGDKILVHHYAGDQPALGLPKQVKANTDGSLYLSLWNGADRMNGMETDFPDLTDHSRTVGGTWERMDSGWKGKAGLLYSAALSEDQWDDFDLSCTVTCRGERASVLFRTDKVTEGLHLTLDFERNVCEFGALFQCHTGGFRLSSLDVYHAAGLIRGREVHIRILMREEYFEMYMDDRWIFSCVCKSHVWPENSFTQNAPHTGAIGLAVEGGEALFSDLKLKKLTKIGR